MEFNTPGDDLCRIERHMVHFVRVGHAARCGFE